MVSNTKTDAVEEPKQEIVAKTKLESTSDANKIDNSTALTVPTQKNEEDVKTKEGKVRIVEVKEDYEKIVHKAHKLVDQVKYVHYRVHKMSKRLDIQGKNSKCPEAKPNVYSDGDEQENNSKTGKENTCLCTGTSSNVNEAEDINITEQTEKVLTHVEGTMKDINDTMDIIMEKNQFDVEEVVEGELCNECEN